MPTRFRFQDYTNAWNSHDVERLLSFYADDVEVIADAPEPMRGKDVLRQAIERTMTAFPDANGDVRELVENDRKVAGVIRITGTNRGPWAFPNGGAFPATNKKVDYDMATFLDLNAEGKIVRELDIADMAKVLQQLGVNPADLAKAEAQGKKAGASQTAR